MSQQINLLLPALRPRFDWLGLPVVLAAALFGLLLLGGYYGYEKHQVEKLVVRDAAIKQQLDLQQKELIALSQVVSSRKGDSALPQLLEALRAGNEERQAVLAALDSGVGGGRSGFAGALEGFSRQTIDGLWLTRFELAGGDGQIAGSTLDPSLLPRFIEKLNNEAVFSGRRFAALDMQAVEADPAPAPGEASTATAAATAGASTPAATPATTPGKARVPLRHTQFVLRSTLVANPGAAQ